MVRKSEELFALVKNPRLQPVIDSVVDDVEKSAVHACLTDGIGCGLCIGGGHVDNRKIGDFRHYRKEIGRAHV